MLRTWRICVVIGLCLYTGSVIADAPTASGHRVAAKWVDYSPSDGLPLAGDGQPGQTVTFGFDNPPFEPAEWPDAKSMCDEGPKSASPSRRYVRAEALFFKLGSGAGNQPVVVSTEDPNPVVMMSNDGGLGTQVGPRITFGTLNEENRGWELAYFGLLGGDGSATATGDNNLAIPGDLGLASTNFYNADQISAASAGQLHSFEVNRVWQTGNWTLLGGFRYLRLWDTYDLQAGDPDTSASVYHLAAANNLFGGQAGARRTGQLWKMEWDAGGKIGLYGNGASQSQYVTDFPNPEPVYFLRAPVSSDESLASFVGEINLNAGIPLTNWLTARAGYNFLWVEGVALAANQMDFTDTASSGTGTNTTGGVFMHGANVGLEARW